jgi:phage tail sheath protein FI
VASATGVGSTFTLYASSPGSWGNNVWVKVITEPSPSTTFTVQLLDGSGELLEDFANLSVSPADPRYVVGVITSGSSNVTFVKPALPPQAEIPPPAQPNATPIAGVNLAGGRDGPVLAPGDVNFETALGADNAASSNNGFGVSLLNRVDVFNLLCVPGETDETTIRQLQKYCVEKRAFYIVDCPQTVSRDDLQNGRLGTAPGGSAPRSLRGEDSKNSAYYYPWVLAPDPLADNNPAPFPPCGFVAGIYASTDSNQGVWRAPAGIGASLAGVSGLQKSLNDLECGDLTALAINCLREFEVNGDVVLGARTLAGSDQAASQWKYVPIRRFALFLESSLYAGTQWVVFEPNGEALWSRITSSVDSFMQGLLLQGAIQGTTPQEAYFVRCDSENNTQSSIDQGIVNITVGFAPLYPAEFVIIQIAQLAGR